MEYRYSIAKNGIQFKQENYLPILCSKRIWYKATKDNHGITSVWFGNGLSQSVVADTNSTTKVQIIKNDEKTLTRPMTEPV